MSRIDVKEGKYTKQNNSIVLCSAETKEAFSQPA